MNIRKKFMLTPAVVLGLMLVLGMVGLAGMGSSKNSLNDIYNVRFHSFKSSSNALRDLGAAHADVYRLFTWLNNYNEAQIKEAFSGIDKRIADANAHIAELGSNPLLTAEERKEVADIQEQMAKYRKQVVNAIDMVQVDPNLGITSMQTADRLFTGLQKNSEALVDKEEAGAKTSFERSVTVYGIAVSVFVLLVVIAFGAGIIMSFYMSRLVITPLKDAIASAQRIATGNLTGRIHATQRDETGDLLLALSDMQDKLRGIIGGMTRSAHELTEMSAALTETSGLIVQGTAEQHDSASSMAASIEQMSVSINVVSENAADADTEVNASARLSQDGKQTLQEMNHAMQKISTSVNESAQIIEALGRESSRISEIVNVIKDIADQTNLLALNAAIEAARAGEQGRGFAVVADEVRKLAERTANSTQEISEMILAIQGNTEGAVHSMKEGVGIVNRGAEMTAAASDVMSRVEQKSGTVSHRVGEISAALKEQGVASHEIATHVERIAQMAEQTSHASRDVAESAARMSGLAANMEGMVSQFRV